jgi:Flp pilus assembly protein TadD
VRARIAAPPGAGARWVGAVVLVAAGSRVARGDLQGAVPLWEATLGLDREHVSAYTNLGVAAARRGDLRGAVALTRAALALDAERPVAWRNLGDFLRALGDDDGAREAERESLRRR